ncbi:MAG: helix-turn-helix domain containing protein [Candidatus Moranbacteria bacterium]|nr:helix-turn-helix domain containing protein [Candidatus Moranbacteria bacterium]
MNKDKKLQAIKLRRAKKSYRQIAEILGVSKSTVSYWLRDIDWSKNIQRQLTKRAKEISRKRLKHLNNLKKIKWHNFYKKSEKEAKDDFEKLKHNKIFLLGLALYWGEGDKNFSNGIVRVGNIDSDLLRIFKRFLVEVCKISEDKLKINIIVYPDLDQGNCIDYWSKRLDINKNNVYKPVIIDGRHKTRKVSYGVCSIQLGNKYLKKKILIWLDLLSREY